MITIGDKTFDSYKTTLEAEDRDVIIDCEITDVDALTGVTKEIKKRAFSYASGFNAISGLEEINTLFQDPFIGQKLSGVDYVIRFNFSYSVVPSQRSLLYSYNATGALQFYNNVAPATSSIVDYHISDLNCTGGSYANDIEQFILLFKDAAPFFLDLEITLLEVCPTAIFYTNCDGVELELEGGSNDEAVGELQNLYLAPESESTSEVFVRVRENFKSDIDFGQCNTYRSDYKATIYSSPIADPLDRYVLDSGFTKVQVKVTGASAYTNMVQVVFDNLGLTQLQAINLPVTGIPTTLTSAVITMALTPDTYTATLYEVILGVPTPISIDTFVEVTFFGESTAEADCPCSCNDGCIDDGITIKWRNNCGENITTKFDGEIKGGNYQIEGDSFKTYTGEEIYPEVTQRNEYTLVIQQYSDQVFKALAYLIANNLDIEVNGVKYLIKPLTIAPSWDAYSRFGSVQIPIIEKDSILTTKRNCC